MTAPALEEIDNHELQRVTGGLLRLTSWRLPMSRLSNIECFDRWNRMQLNALHKAQGAVGEEKERFLSQAAKAGDVARQFMVRAKDRYLARGFRGEVQYPEP